VALFGLGGPFWVLALKLFALLFWTWAASIEFYAKRRWADERDEVRQQKDG
jgi:hypothetical protein